MSLGNNSLDFFFCFVTVATAEGVFRWWVCRSDYWPKSSRKWSAEKISDSRTVVQNLNKFWPSRWFGMVLMSQVWCWGTKTKTFSTTGPKWCSCSKFSKKSVILQHIKKKKKKNPHIQSHGLSLVALTMQSRLFYADFSRGMVVPGLFFCTFTCSVFICIHLHSYLHSYVYTGAQEVNLQTHLCLQNHSSSCHSV